MTYLHSFRHFLFVIIFITPESIFESGNIPSSLQFPSFPSSETGESGTNQTYNSLSCIWLMIGSGDTSAVFRKGGALTTAKPFKSMNPSSSVPWESVLALKHIVDYDSASAPISTGLGWVFSITRSRRPRNGARFSLNRKCADVRHAPRFPRRIPAQTT